MSAPPLSSPEALLCQAYREEVDCYARALQVAEDLPATLHPEHRADQQLQMLGGYLDRVAAIEAGITVTKQEWVRSGQRPGPELQSVLERVAELMERLARAVQAAEQEATRQKDRLAPELDDMIRGQQMHRAYRGARNASSSEEER